jgi:hypothetical protein
MIVTHTVNDQREKDLFAKALELPENQQPAYLQAACGGDIELRRRVEALLEAHNQSGGFLQEQLAPPPITTFVITNQVIRAVEDAVGEHLPRTFGPFKLLELVAETNMSKVYKAREENPPRTVALKMPWQVQQEGNQRFVIETQMTVEAFAANIVPVLQAGEIAGVPYYTMPFIEGKSLMAHVRERELDLAQKLDLFEKVCVLVQKLHARKLVHLDLKPGNIIVDAHSDVWLLDFGISRSLASRVGVPGVGGTPAYMAPEQTYEDRPKTHAADVYALGVILYELLTGQTPYQIAGPGEDFVRIVRETQPLAPSVRQRDVPDRYDSLVIACLRKEPQGRPQSAGELLKLLQQARLGLNPAAPFDPALKRRLWAVAAGVALLAALASAAFWLRPRPPTELELIKADAGVADVAGLLEIAPSGFQLELSPRGGSRDFFKGEPLRFEARSARECYMAFFLHSRDGKTYLFAPDAAGEGSPLPTREANVESKATVGKPFGLEVVQVIACTRLDDYHSLLSRFQQVTTHQEFASLLKAPAAPDGTRGLEQPGAPDPAKWSSAYLTIQTREKTK